MLVEGCHSSADGLLPRTGRLTLYLTTFEIFLRLQMASPRTRRVLAELRPKDGNNVSSSTIFSSETFTMLASCFIILKFTQKTK